MLCIIIIMAEAEYNEEKGLLGPPLKPHRRYGSTSVNMKKPDHVLVHVVSKDDTIQGIALKYGVTVEIIKRHNKLWSPGAVFLHNSLEIPVSQVTYESIIKKNPLLALPSPSRASPSLTNESSSRESDCSSDRSSPSINKHSNETQSPPATNGLHDCSEKSPLDILTKIDSNIAQMKSNIAKMETHSYPVVDQMEVDDSCQITDINHRRQLSDPNPYPKCWNQSHQRYQNGWQDPTALPPTIVTNPTRTITMSLKRLLRDHEELYEL